MIINQGAGDGGRKQDSETVPKRYLYGPTRVSLRGGGGRTSRNFPDEGGGGSGNLKN
jgi:hypothetical protein